MMANDASRPASILISYTAVGLLVYVVMCGLGEMAAWLPHASGFSGYASRFCDPALGFALGWTYWCKYIITTPNQLTASALIIQYWDPNKKINPGVWIAIFLVIIICVNYFGIKFFGELEFWLSSIKVVVIVSVAVDEQFYSLTDDALGWPHHPILLTCSWSRTRPCDRIQILQKSRCLRVLSWSVR
jgi:amino acid permease